MADNNDDAELRAIAARKRGMVSIAPMPEITPESKAIDDALRHQLAVSKGKADAD